LLQRPVGPLAASLPISTRGHRGIGKERPTWTLVYAGNSVPSIQAAVVAGLGVSVLGIHSTAIGMRILQPEEGFPALNGMEIMLYGEEKFEGSIAKALFPVHETVLSRMWERASRPPMRWPQSKLP